MPRLLIVDDRIEICDLLAMFCTEQGYGVTIACDGASAKDALGREKFDCVIVDVVLPQVSGLAIAEFASSRGVPVLLISGEPNSIVKLNGNSRHPFLQKPFHLDELGSALRVLLQRHGPQSNG